MQMFQKEKLIDTTNMQLKMNNCGNNNGLLDTLGALGDLLGILNYIENLQQTKNDVIMKQLRKQDSVYFKQILENQARIEEKLDKLLDKQEQL